MKPLIAALAAKLRHAIGRWVWRGPTSREELLHCAQLAEKNQIVQPDVLRMIERVLSVSDLQARDIMIPRVQMVTIHIDASLEEIHKIVVSSGHSRFPVISEKEIDETVNGILLAKDLIADLDVPGNGSFRLHELLRPVMHVPESIRLNVLLKKFQETRSHMAIIVNEYEGIAGLVTIEDVLEEIVGEIEDESDFDSDEQITRVSDHEFLVDAQMDIDEFNAHASLQIADDDVETIGGLLLKLAGKVPSAGEKFEHQGMVIEVIDADGRRLRQLRITLPAPQAP